MARDLEAKCRKCRRAGEKLFLKGERCNTQKCAVVKRAYPPGVHGKSISRGLSEFGVQLMAKQKVKRTYGILEKQFHKHFEEIRNKKGITGDLLMARIETRLDNVAYRLGFASSRSQARQLVNHGLLSVNGRKTTIPSFEVRIGDTVQIRASKTGKNYFKQLEETLKNKKDHPSWLAFDWEKREGKVLTLPPRSEIGVNVNPQVIVEYYSR